MPFTGWNGWWWWCPICGSTGCPPKGDEGWCAENLDDDLRWLLTTSSSGTEGGICIRKSRRSLGGLEERRELDLTTLDVLGSKLRSSRRQPSPRTTVYIFTFFRVIGYFNKSQKRIQLHAQCRGNRNWFMISHTPKRSKKLTFKSNISVPVISEGSTRGSGRLLFKIILLPTWMNASDIVKYT